MPFIILSSGPEARDVFVNSDQITHMGRVSDYRGHDYTLLWLNNRSDPLEVNETPGEIISLIVGTAGE